MNHNPLKFVISRKILPGFSGAAILVILAVLPLILNSYGLSLLTQVLIFGLFAMSLDILMGYTGLVSFNHATYLGVGAYTVGILFHQGLQNFWIALISGVIVPVLLAMLLGLLVLRSSGPYFLMITLAFGQMIFALAWKWRSLTGGDDGLPGVARPEIMGSISMWNNQHFYYLVLAFFVVGIFLLWSFVRSPIGKAVVGVRESESRMQALGYNTWGLKYLAYIIAGGFAGLAGVLYVYCNGFVSPQELNWTMSGLVILMVIIGGAGTLLGPVVGAGIILILQNLISSYTERWPLFMGVMFVLCVIYARNGIVGYLMRLRDKGRTKNDSLGSKGTQ